MHQAGFASWRRQARFFAEKRGAVTRSRLSREAALLQPPLHANLVSMTRKAAASETAPAPPARSRWRLQDAKARFSELVRLAHSDGPQHVTLHGRDAVVVVDAEEFQRLKGVRTGQLLIDALQASPHLEIDIAPRRSAMPVRSVKL
jgi:prevent-host-death family protein